MRDAAGNAMFLIRTRGGPIDGETRSVPETAFPWPLPPILEHPGGGGHYVKIAESTLPEEVDDNDHVARGAEYEWIPEGEVAEEE